MTYAKGTPRRKTLLTLRWLAVALTCLILLRPNLVFVDRHEEPSTLVLLADRSKSMILRDMWADQSRWEAMSKMLAGSQSALERLAEKLSIRQFVFDRVLGEGEILTQTPDGDRTNIGDALGEIVKRTAGERLGAVIILSDGTNTSGAPPLSIARQFSAQKVPIYTFGFGRETVSEQVRDLAARNILTSPTVFVKNRMSVRGEFTAPGFGGQTFPVKLLLDGEVEARGSVTIASDSNRGTVELSAIPKRPGDIKVTLEVEPQTGELLTDNNSMSTYITALAGGISVLEIEGKYRFWEPKFLRWALDRSPDIELTQLYLLDSSGTASTIPPELLQPGKFDVILLGDVAARQFTVDQMNALRDLVNKGTGLAMLGGYTSFGPGGWGTSPLADILPVVMSPVDGQIQEPLPMLPTDTGNRHYLLRLSSKSPQDNEKLWQQLRPLDGASQWKGLKAGAIVLAKSSDGKPLLVAQDYGRGRVIAFAGDTTWRWRRGEEGIDVHARFWRQMILWLSHREELAGTEIKVHLERRRLGTGQKLPIEVRVESADGKIVSDANVQGMVTTPSGAEVPVDLFRQGDKYQGVFWQTEEAGDYKVRVVATRNSKDLGATEVRFLVYDEDVEMQQLAADLQLLRSISELTGGTYHTPDQLRKFLEELEPEKLNLEVDAQTYESLWDRWETLLLFAFLIATEWFIRKRHNLP